MKRELLPLLSELCYLATLRNAINTRRHRARFRKNYYANAVRVVEAHNGENSETRNIRKQIDQYSHAAPAVRKELSKLNKRLSDIRDEMSFVRQKYPNPKKWKSMGLHKLRSLVLKNEGEYAMAKHETMEFTMKHRVRVQYLMAVLDASMRYDNGSVTMIYFGSKVLCDSLNQTDMKRYAERYELDEAVQNMVEE